VKILLFLLVKTVGNKNSSVAELTSIEQSCLVYAAKAGLGLWLTREIQNIFLPKTFS
jgi:hypothetical protein